MIKRKPLKVTMYKPSICEVVWCKSKLLGF